MTQFLQNPATLWTIGGILIAGLLTMVGFGFRDQILYMLDRPKSWSFLGVPGPANVDVAMGVIWTNRPMTNVMPRWGGRITWVKDPIKLIEGTAGGTVTDMKIPTFDVQSFEPVWATALTHEVGHYLWTATYGNAGEVPGKSPGPEFEKWVENTNARIKSALTPVKAG